MIYGNLWRNCMGVYLVRKKGDIPTVYKLLGKQMKPQIDKETEAFTL